MEKTFDYIQTKIFEEDIHIKDIGNCIIEGVTEFGLTVYLWIKTDDGFSKILQIGPCAKDKDIMYFQKSFSISYSRISYKENALIKIIDTFLNKSNIIQAQEISEELIVKTCNIDILKFMESN